MERLERLERLPCMGEARVAYTSALTEGISLDGIDNTWVRLGVCPDDRLAADDIREYTRECMLSKRPLEM